jgi:glycosyltransferase involved in cell wall biosynthesis
VFLNGSGQPGGGEIALAQLAAAVPGARIVLFEDGAARTLFESVGLRVSLLALSESVRKVSKESGLPSPRVVVGAVRHVFKVARALRDADVVHCNNQKAWVIGAIASWIARKPVVWHLHDILSAEHFSRTKIRLVVALANWRKARVLANSQASLDAFLAAGGSAARSEVLYNPVDPSPFLQARPIPGFRESLGCQDAPVWGVFSRLASWKGQHVAIEALARVPRGHLILVGAPFFGEEPWEAHLKGLVASLGLQQRVHFLGFRSDVPALLASIDGAIHCSTVAEPFGLVILEAQLSGKPVVATAAGGALEIVHPPHDGWLTPPGDVDALAEVLKAWSSHPGESAAVGLRARDAAAIRFEAQSLSRHFLSILESEARP